MKRGIIWAVLLGLVGLGGWSVHATSFNSTNFSINGNLGDSTAGGQGSTNYSLTSATGESIAGNSSSSSYKLGQGYVSTLQDNTFQLNVQPTGLEAYYPLDEGSGARAFDASANNRNVTLNGNTWSGTGQVAGSLWSNRFIEGTQYGNAGDFDVSGSAITVSAWVSPFSSFSATQKLISKQTATTDAQGSIGLSSNKAQFEITTGGTYRNVVGTTSLTLNNWYHIVGVYDGSTAKLYVNGVQDGSVAATGTMANNNVGWSLGSRNGSTALDYFVGRIDEAKIYSRALGADEVKAEYDAGAAGFVSGLYVPSVTPGTSQTSAFDSMIQTSAPGYTLAINQNNNLTSGSNTISPVSGSIGSPVSWSEGSTKGLGFTLYGTNATAIPGSWNSGNSYAAIPGTATSFYTRTGLNGGAKDILNMRLRLDTTSSQAGGSYTNQMTITGTMTP